MGPLTRREILRGASFVGLAGVGGGSLASVLGACASSAPSVGGAGTTVAVPAYHELQFSVSDSGYTLPAAATAGLTTVTLVNTGAAPHLLAFRKLKAGKTFADFAAAQKASALSAFDLVDDLGGVITPAPGSTKQVVIDLQGGDYVLMSRGPEVAQGLIAPFHVAASSATDLPAPTPALTVSLRDGVPADVPSALRVGKQIWEVRGDGTLHHHLAIGLIKPGAALADVEKWIAAHQGPPPFVGAGGMHILSPGKRGWAYLDLAAGSYVGWCDLPGPKAGQDHFENGHEIVNFTVS